jgi:type IV secretion system protein VirB1
MGIPMTPATFIALAAACAPNVHPQTLHSVVRHESGYNVFAIGINKAARVKSQPGTRHEAIAIAKRLMQQNVKFDAGLAQINVRNLAWLSMSLDDLFDPCKNLKASSLVLSACYKRASLQYGEGQHALRAALSCYNTGNFEGGFANGYVSNVVAEAQTYVPAIALEPVKPGDTASMPVDAPDKKEPRRGDAFSTPDADAFTKAASQKAK